MTLASVARQRGGAKPNGAPAFPLSGSRQERGLSPGLVADERTPVAAVSQVPIPDVIEAMQVTDAAGIVWTRLAACWAEHADLCRRERVYDYPGGRYLARCCERSAWTSAAGGLCGRHFADALEVGR